MFTTIFKKIAQPSVQTLPNELDYNRLPVLNAEQLIQLTEQQNRIRSIKRIVNIDEARFQMLYLDVIHQFAEMVQLMPASQAHHHAVPGGLLIHTLEVIENAMVLRQKYKLPAFAEPETQERERHAWTYAIFAAAILHDIGKRITLCVFVRDDEQVQSAFDTPLPQSQCRYYKLVFQDPKYHHLHERLGLALIDVLPSIGKSFLFAHLNIIKEMIAYIHDDKYNAGMIGEIIRQADQQSTGRSLAHTPSRKFKGASLENLGERLMTQLRQLIASNHFVVNKTNANIYTCKDGYAYCVAKVIVDGIREDLAKQDITDVPSDNNRIFDTFQEYGFTETNPRTGKSIHTICLYHNGNIRPFTVLKFATSKLFRNPPPPFDGVIEEIANKAAVQSSPSEPVAKAQPPEPMQKSTKPTLKTETNPTDSPTNQSMPQGDLLDELLNTPEMSNADNETPIAEPTADDTTIVTEKVNNMPTTERPNQLAYDFLAWCRAKVKDKTAVINESNGMVQKVNYKGNSVIAVVTPRIFYEYATEIGLENPKDKRSFAKIQNAIHREKLNIVNATGQIHIYKIKKSHNNPMNGNIKIRHYLFEVEKFADGDEIFAEIVNKSSENKNLIHD